MGLFSKKESNQTRCLLCQEKFSLVNYKFKLNSDEYICTRCVILLSGMLKEDNEMLRSKSTTELQDLYHQKKNEIEANLEHFSKFEPNVKIGTWAEFDDKNNIASFRTGFSSKPNYKVNYDDIEDFSVIENGKSIVKSGAASAAAGGILFGPTGAIVGGLLSRGNKKESCSKLKVSISIKNDSIKDIVLINSKTKTDSSLYKLSQGSLKSIVTKLDKIINPKIHETKTVTANNLSNADEIRKFKELMDDGILTKEEFEMKKKELLNL